MAFLDGEKAVIFRFSYAGISERFKTKNFDLAADDRQLPAGSLSHGTFCMPILFLLLGHQSFLKGSPLYE